MIVPGSTNPLLMRSAAVAAYQISRSLRFNPADSAYLRRTPASAGNRKTWTWSSWVKKSSNAEADFTLFFACVVSASEYVQLGFSTSDQLALLFRNASGTSQSYSNNVFRDNSAWYHFVISFDTTQATAANRLKAYVNGVEITYATDDRSNIVQNTDFLVNSTNQHAISSYQPFASGRYHSGYLAEVNFVDGQALGPTSFGQFDTNNVWQPKAYSGSYGTNGFHLDFADNSDTTSTTLGKDTSGNSNNFTPSGFSVTAGSGNDSLTDTPTSYGTDTGTGAEVRGNYATLNPNNQRNSITLSNGNLDLLSTTSTYAMSAGTIACVEKTYFEVRVGGPISAGRNAYFGVGSNGDINRYNNNYLGSDALAWALGHDSSGTYYILHNGSFTSQSGTAVAGDILMYAVDPPNGKIWFGRNGTWYAGNPAAGTGASYTNLPSTVFPILQGYNTGPHSANFGQRAFAYTAPSGFKALVDTNLTAPTIAKPSTAFDVVTYTGTGSTLTPTSSLGFSPDLIWIKSRSAATDNTLYDTVRGAEKRLESNTTDAEVTSDGGVTAFNSNGFTLGTLAQVNTNAATYVGWCWDGGTSTVTNTNGTITSSVRANASAGISVVTWTAATNATNTIGHGLGVAPSWVIVKSRTNAASWRVYTSVTGVNAYMGLDSNAASTTYSGYWGSAPTSTTFGVWPDATSANNIGNMVGYCFAPVAGFSAFGSYTGNGSADGPFVYLGFRPGWILVKASSTGGSTYDWFVYDTERDTYNAASKFLSPNYSGAEQATADAGTLTDVYFDILSNGFKVRNNRGRVNLNAATFVYAAFAEYPFAYARAR